MTQPKPCNCGCSTGQLDKLKQSESIFTQEQIEWAAHESNRMQREAVGMETTTKEKLSKLYDGDDEPLHPAIEHAAYCNDNKCKFCTTTYGGVLRQKDEQPTEQWEEIMRTDKCIYIKGEPNLGTMKYISEIEEKYVVALGDCEIIESDLIKTLINQAKSESYKQGFSDGRDDVFLSDACKKAAEEARREVLDSPMGYSKWLEHGKKYGYLDFYNKYL